MTAPIEPKPLNIYQKLLKIKSKVTHVNKDSKVSTGMNGPSYMAVSHDNVTEHLNEHFTDMGVLAFPEITNATTVEFKRPDGKSSFMTELWIDMEFINADNPTERFIKKGYAYAIDSGDKATGKAFSMAVKYVYLKCLQLVSGDNEEERENEGFYNNRAGRVDSKPSFKLDEPARETSNINTGNNADRQRNDYDGSANNGQNSGQKSYASDKQISAIKSLCEKKGILVSQNFKNKESCSAKEASDEIKRLYSL